MRENVVLTQGFHDSAQLFGTYSTIPIFVERPKSLPIHCFLFSSQILLKFALGKMKASKSMTRENLRRAKLVGIINICKQITISLPIIIT